MLAAMWASSYVFFFGFRNGKKDEFFLVCTHPLQGAPRQGRRRGGEEGVVFLLLRAAVGGTRLRMRDVLQADRALADLVELATPAASASGFPASSLRFPLPRQQPPLPRRQPPLPRLERRRLANSLQFPPQKRKRQRTHQHALDARAVDAGRAQVGEHDVVVGAAGDERVAALLEACRVFSPRFFVFLGFETVSFPFFLFVPSRPPPSHSPFSRRSLSYRRRGPWSWRAPASDTR